MDRILSKDELDSLMEVIAQYPDAFAHVPPGEVFPLIWAASYGRCDVIRALLDAGADVDAACESDGSMALHYAAATGETNAALLLMEAGAHIDARCIRDGKTLTPLSLAIGGRHEDVALALLACGAAIFNDGEEHPVHVAIENGCVEVLRELLRLGARTDTVCPRTHFKPIHKVSIIGDMLMLSELIGAGASVRECDADGYTPLHALAVSSNLADSKEAEKCTHALLEAGASLEAVDRFGKTPLMHACTGCPGTTRILLEAGADVLSPHSSGITVLQLAVGNSKWDVVRVLLDYYDAYNYDLAHAFIDGVALEHYSKEMPADLVERLAVLRCVRSTMDPVLSALALSPPQ